MQYGSSLIDPVLPVMGGEEHMDQVTPLLSGKYHICTRKNLISFSKSANKPSTKVVFALLVPSCQQVWNKLLATCNNLVDIIRLVARLFQQVRYSHDITILSQPCVVNLVTFLFYHDYSIRIVRTTL